MWKHVSQLLPLPYLPVLPVWISLFFNAPLGPTILCVCLSPINSSKMHHLHIRIKFYLWYIIGCFLSVTKQPSTITLHLLPNQFCIWFAHVLSVLLFGPFSHIWYWSLFIVLLIIFQKMSGWNLSNIWLLYQNASHFDCLIMFQWIPSGWMLFSISDFCEFWEGKLLLPKQVLPVVKPVGL